MSTDCLKLITNKRFKSSAFKKSVLQILALAVFLICATPALAHDESQHDGVVVNGIELSGFQVFALERATGKDIPNGNYWYEMATDKWGHVDGPDEGFLNLPESFKKYIAEQVANAAKTPTELARTVSYSDCTDDCWY